MVVDNRLIEVVAFNLSVGHKIEETADLFRHMKEVESIAEMRRQAFVEYQDSRCNYTLERYKIFTEYYTQAKEDCQKLEEEYISKAIV